MRTKTIARRIRRHDSHGPHLIGGGHDSNVLPCFTANNTSAGSNSYSKLSMKTATSPPLLFMEPSHFYYLLYGKLCGSGVFSSQRRIGTFVVFPFGFPEVLESFSAFKPTLLQRVLHIVLLVSKKKVFWSYAFRMVAFVKNPKTVWNWSINKFPRMSMCANLISVYVKHAVSCVFSKFPSPASVITFFHMVPKRTGDSVFLVDAPAGFNGVVGSCQRTHRKRLFVPAFAKTNVPLGFVSAGRNVRLGLFNHFEFAELASDEALCIRHGIGRFNIMFSGGRPASTGARCDYCKPKQWRFNVKQHEIALTN